MPLQLITSFDGGGKWEGVQLAKIHQGIKARISFFTVQQLNAYSKPDWTGQPKRPLASFRPKSKGDTMKTTRSKNRRASCALTRSKSSSDGVSKASLDSFFLVISLKYHNSPCYDTVNPIQCPHVECQQLPPLSIQIRCRDKMVSAFFAQSLQFHQRLFLCPWQNS